MALNRSWVRRIEHGASRVLESFRLKSGGVHYFDPQQGAIEIFMFTVDSDPDAEAPPFLRKVLEEAEDPREVLSRFRSPGETQKFIDPVRFLDAPEDAHPLAGEDVPDLSD